MSTVATLALYLAAAARIATVEKTARDSYVSRDDQRITLLYGEQVSAENLKVVGDHSPVGIQRQIGGGGPHDVPSTAAIPLDLLHRALNLAVGLGGIKRVRGIFFVDRRDLVERRCRMDEMEAAALAMEDAISMRCSGEPEIRAAADDAGRRFRSVSGCLCWFCLRH